MDNQTSDFYFTQMRSRMPEELHFAFQNYNTAWCPDNYINLARIILSGSLSRPETFTFIERIPIFNSCFVLKHFVDAVNEKFDEMNYSDSKLGFDGIYSFMKFLSKAETNTTVEISRRHVNWSKSKMEKIMDKLEKLHTTIDYTVEMDENRKFQFKYHMWRRDKGLEVYEKIMAKEYETAVERRQYDMKKIICFMFPYSRKKDCFTNFLSKMMMNIPWTNDYLGYPQQLHSLMLRDECGRTLFYEGFTEEIESIFKSHHLGYAYAPVEKSLQSMYPEILEMIKNHIYDLQSVYDKIIKKFEIYFFLFFIFYFSPKYGDADFFHDYDNIQTFLLAPMVSFFHLHLISDSDRLPFLYRPIIDNDNFNFFNLSVTLSEKFILLFQRAMDNCEVMTSSDHSIGGPKKFSYFFNTKNFSFLIEENEITAQLPLYRTTKNSIYFNNLTDNLNFFGRFEEMIVTDSPPLPLIQLLGYFFQMIPSTHSFYVRNLMLEVIRNVLTNNLEDEPLLNIIKIFSERNSIHYEMEKTKGNVVDKMTRFQLSSHPIETHPNIMALQEFSIIGTTEFMINLIVEKDRIDENFIQRTILTMDDDYLFNYLFYIPPNKFVDWNYPLLAQVNILKYILMKKMNILQLSPQHQYKKDVAAFQKIDERSIINNFVQRLISQIEEGRHLLRVQRASIMNSDNEKEMQRDFEFAILQLDLLYMQIDHVKSLIEA
ncbi:hypothetical protein SNEBB_003845 [Seison nebaliae]|nr:hypothetical protein SNEBB_003845 [Seison nebaliae]